MSFARYRDRVLLKGSTSQERIIYEKKKSFDDYLSFIPNAYTVTISGVEHKVAMQDVKFHDYLSEEKYMLTKIGLDVNAGALIEWDDMNWLTVTKESETVKGHQSYKIGKCNQILKWQDEDSVIHTTPCILSDKTSVFSDGLSKTEFISVGTDQMGIIVQANSETLAIPINKRFIFQHDKNNTYEINRRDTLTLEGLISFVVKKSPYFDVYDNLELNLANYNGKRPTEPDKPNQVAIAGESTITIYDKNVEYTVNTDKSVKWSLSRTDIIKFVSIDGNKCYIQFVDKSKIGDFTLTATLEDGVIINKDIELLYM